MTNWILIAHITFSLTIIPMGIAINTKLYQNVKLEKHRENGKIIQLILMTYSIVQCILPALIHIVITPFQDSGLLEKLDPTLFSILVQAFRTLTSLYIFYVGCNSLIIACARYLFIVFSHKANQIGISRLKFIFTSSCIFLPLCLVFLRECVFSIERNQIQRIMTIQEQKCGNYSSSNNNNITECVNEVLNSMEFPLYEFIQKTFNSTLLSIVRSIIILVTTIIHSNIVELIIYIHVFTFCIR